MTTPIFLYPSLTDSMRECVFQAKNYVFSYLGSDGNEKELSYETSEIGTAVNCLRTDGVWSADEYNLYVDRDIALKNYNILFGPSGIACRNACLGVSLVWTSSDSKQRGAKKVMEFCFDETQSKLGKDNSFIEGSIDFEFKKSRIRGDVYLSVVIYIAKAGIPNSDEYHLANEEGIVLGSLDTFVLRLEGSGSLFPVFEVYEKEQPLWYVRCDWTDPTCDKFTENVSIIINKGHPNYKYIDQTQKTFCSQLLVEIMSSAMCCIIEKIRSEQDLDEILSGKDMEPGSVGEIINYFDNTLGWDLSTPEKLSLSTRKFFDRRLDNLWK